jgi:hypothetical protein
VVTVILRHQQWVAAGTAAYALTYSGVAAIHLVVLFVVYNQSPGNPARSICWPKSSESLANLISPIPICTGVYDPDFAEACRVVSVGLLAVLPMATWSKTFQHVSAKPILVMWTLLLAIGHMFYNLIVPDDHRHYQICPTGRQESLPGRDYKAVPFNVDWERKVRAIFGKTTSTPLSQQVCAYTCFASDAYTGRMFDEIGVFHANVAEMNKSRNSRELGIAYWFLYAFFAMAAVMIERRYRWR